MPDPDSWADTADDIRRTREAEARDTRDAVRDKLAERVAELEAGIRAALLHLRQDRPHAAAGRLEQALARPAGEPDHA